MVSKKLDSLLSRLNCLIVSGSCFLMLVHGAFKLVQNKQERIQAELEKDWKTESVTIVGKVESAERSSEFFDVDGMRSGYF